MIPIIALIPALVKLAEHVAEMMPQIKDALNSNHLTESEKTELKNRLDIAAEKISRVEIRKQSPDA